MPSESVRPYFSALSRAALCAALILLPAHGALAQVCPCSIWSASTTPGPMEQDAGAVELGVKFTSDSSGLITGLRFYKYAQNTGTHTGNLWTTGGQLLGTLTFAGETASGWQQASFTTPISIAAGVTYIASYHTNTGFYAANGPGLASAVNNPPLHALADAASGGNGVYRYGAASAFPNQTYNGSNYWVDVVFSPVADITPPTVSGLVPANGATGVGASPAITATFSEAMTASTITPATLLLTGPGGAVPATASYNASTFSAMLTPSAPLAGSTTYTATVKGGASGVKDAAGNALASDVTWTFTTAAPGVCPCSIWSGSSTPGPMENESSAVELGVKFTSDTAGNITALRFYKYAQNSGTHVGNLWTAAGQLLASVTFSGETASGWQQQALPAPVAIAANTTYVASYHTNTGFYAATSPGGFTSAVDNPPLHALSDAAGGGNGVYRYGASSAFPNLTYNASNYWVDAVFALGDTTPPAISSKTPASGATGVAAISTVTATFGEAMTASTISASTMLLTGPGNVAVPATVAYNAATFTATLTPAAALALGTTYTATVKGGASGVKDAAGNALVSDVTWTFTTVPDSTAPSVSSVAPPSGAANVPLGAVVTATFSEPMNASTVIAGIKLVDQNGVVVAGTVTYDAPSATGTFTPSSPLAANKTYTATVKGGVGGVADTAGNPMISDVAWAFLTVQAACPCSLWTNSTAPGPNSNEAASLELGVKFQSDFAGYITGLRFYKYAQSGGTHTGNLWTAAGQLLATVAFSNETASGWQQVTLPTPVPIAANTTYISSYFTSSGFYPFTTNGFASAIDVAPLHGLSNGASGGNGVYRYGAASAFPSQSYQSSNYWVDVVFSLTAADTAPPTVSMTTPASGTGNVSTATTVTAAFNEALDITTVSASTFQLRNASNALVPAGVAYDSNTRTATLTPSAVLAAGGTYTATLTTAVKDLAGNALAAAVNWGFATSSPAMAPGQGAGGPILVVTSSSNPFTTYYAELLRAEGLNQFAVTSLGNVTSGLLAGYDVVILGEQALTSSQVTTFTNWVNGGGKLIAFRPDTKLASLLGISRQGTTTVSNGYLAIDTSVSPGAGLVSQTMQFHGVADAYVPTSGSVLAMLYSDATHTTAYPAATLRSVGGSGGQAAAFTFDLARSIVYTRQGNPAWSGQARDGDPQGGIPATIRSDDLFFGAMLGDVQPNWVDLSRVAIPQADEQQRLLANLIHKIENTSRPMPRLWYFPKGAKAVVVMTGDDHANGGTLQRMNQYSSMSPANCSVANWECIRSTSYIYSTTPITAGQVSSLTAQGFEIGVHITMSPATQYGCGPNYTQSTLTAIYTSQITAFKTAFPAAPAPATIRTHCVIWSDWSSQPVVEAANGVRLDTNYYYWPGSWVNNVPGMFTGSGMPMRFADLTGSMVDVYQATTQMTDESGQTYPITVDTLLNNATGPLGYYGAFTANMHTDYATTPGSDAIVGSALARGVPIVSAKQMLTWLDARNSSAFGPIVWSGSTLTFSVAPGANANGLQVMVPFNAGALHLSGVTLTGVPVVYSTQTIKGISYAFVTVAAGQYAATYVP